MRVCHVRTRVRLSFLLPRGCHMTSWRRVPHFLCVKDGKRGHRRRGWIWFSTPEGYPLPFFSLHTLSLIPPPQESSRRRQSDCQVTEQTLQNPFTTRRLSYTPRSRNPLGRLTASSPFLPLSTPPGPTRNDHISFSGSAFTSTQHDAPTSTPSSRLIFRFRRI